MKNQLLPLLALITFLSLPLKLSAEAVVIRMLPPPEDSNLRKNNYSYYAEVLNLAFDKTVEEFGKYTIEHSQRMSGPSSLLDLSRQSGELDIIWRGADPKREKVLLPVKVPILRGLLGLRIALVHENRQADYEKINTIEDLQQWRICQGRFWADSKILNHSEINVVSKSSFPESAVSIIQGDCDAYLASIAIDYSDRLQQYPLLKLVNQPLIYYPLPAYFYVRKSNQELHDRLILGLERSIKDGSFDKLFLNHPISQHIHPLFLQENIRVIALPNPLLNEIPDEFENRLVIKPKQVSLGNNRD